MLIDAQWDVVSVNDLFTASRRSRRIGKSERYPPLTSFGHMVEAAHTAIVLRETPLTTALHTTMRDKTASRHQFVTASNRLVRLLIEEALGLLPSTPVTIETPCGPYTGCKLPEEDRLEA